MKKTTLLMGRLAFITLVCLFSPTVTFAQTSQTITPTDTQSFTVPAGVTSITIKAWGGGGRGGSRSAGANSGYGGGGGGAYASSVLTVTPGTTYNLSVGSGSTSNSTPGEDTWFNTTSVLLAKGGGTVANNVTTGASGGLASASIGTTKFSGGNGGNAVSTTSSGGGGGSAGSTGAGGNAGNATAGIAGAGAAGSTGAAGAAGRTTNGNGTAGNIPGSGGGGALRTTGSPTGGNGGNGQMIITWNCPTYALTSTSAPATACQSSSITVNLSGNVTGLPVGTYTVNYSFSGANTATTTATMTVTTAGTGSFTTTTLTNGGATTVKINSLSSGGSTPCTSTITANNSASVSVTALPAQPSTIAGNAAPCIGTSQVYSVTNVTGTSYSWTFPTGWTQTAGGTTNSVTVTVGSGTGNISVTPSISCGNGTARTLAVTVSTIPVQPVITGAANPCTGVATSYTVTAVAGVTFNWTVPSGWTINSGAGTNSINVTPTATSGQVTCSPVNTCGTGALATFNVAPSSIPSQPATISGASDACIGSSQIYTVPNVSGVTYAWTFPSGWTQTAGGTTNSITVTVGSTAGNISVTPSNSCGTGTARTLAVTTWVAPSVTSTTPGSRIGFGTVVLGAAGSGSSTLNWYNDSVGGSPIATGTSFTTPDLVTTTVFYVEAILGPCPSTRVAVTATVNLPEITVFGNGASISDEDDTPETVDFTNLGTTTIGANIVRTYTIQNTGTVSLAIGTITISGLNAADFTITATPAATLAANATTTFSIRFAPSALGNRDATISFPTNDYDENPFNFSIRGVGGTGLSAEINLTGNGNTILDGDTGPTTTDGTNFGTAVIPATITKTFTIQNTGTGPLTLSGSPIVSLTGSGYFTVSAQPSANTIAAGGSRTFTITFTPVVPGTFVAIVSIANDDSDESLYDFVIQASALVNGKEIDILGNDVSIVDGDTTPSATDQTDFGITDTATAISIPYIIYSAGSNTLTFSSTTVGISGTNASQFTATALPSNLASGAITSFVVTFTPNTSLGVKTATITISSDDSDEGTYTFSVSAEVQAPTIPAISPGGIATNLRFWLRADSNIGVYADNEAVTRWTEQSAGTTKTAIAKTSQEPVFQNNTSSNINFNPVVKFNGSNSMSGGQGFNNTDMYIVIKPKKTITYQSSAQDVYCGDDIATNKNSQDVTGFELGNTSSRHSNELLAYNQGANTAYGTSEVNTTKSYTGVNIFNPRKSAAGRMEILCNGGLLNTTEILTNTYKDITNSRYWLGRSEFFDASFEGDILEIINYNTRNTDANRRRIETYLAIKYGITLGVNGTSLNYVDSAGNTIYSSGAGFNYNIAGIGRDDNSNLNQKQSKTENTVSDVTMGLSTIEPVNSDNTNTFANDRDFLVWGNNNATLAAQSPIVVNMSAGISGLTTNVDFVSVGRIWRVVETGSVPKVKISIPATMLTATITPPGDFLMFVSSSPIFSPTAEYRIMKQNGSNLETDYDFNGVKYITFGYAPERTFVRSVAFDGVDDYLDAGNVLDLSSSFTVSAWVKRNGTNKTIFSKRDAAFTSGYEMKINSGGYAEMTWKNGSASQTITSTVTMPANIWHNIAVTFDGTTAKMYIDGVLNVTEGKLPATANSESFLIAAADGNAPTSFFNGTIDEVRIWNSELTVSQLRYIMNQEIYEHTDSTVNGRILPQTVTKNEVKDIPWNALEAYYPMSTYTYTNAKDESRNHYTASVRNLITVDTQTAPVPYITSADSDWSLPTTWVNNSVQDPPYSLSIVDGTTRIAWNIVDINNNITSNENEVVLGLVMEPSKTYKVQNNKKIEVSHYLKLNGKIDLVDLSQLVQPLNSDLETSSAGSLERDQQGTKNMFNYNYWSSPVSSINTSSNNSSFTIASVFKDGTDPNNIKDINFVNGYYGGATDPITIGNYWIFKFQNLSNAYANWTYVGSTGSLSPGMGWTMKGSNTASSYQNYTFLGKPNNGSISIPVSAGNLNLSGNPYASALDGYTFIDNNLDAIDGTLYFWEHYATNNTHVLASYQGGYAALTKVGGTPPVSPSNVSGLGTTSHGAPKRFIPVGQGFFVTGNATGGSVKFNNNQRLFVKEDNAANSNTLFRNAPELAGQTDEDVVTETPYKKLRIGFTFTNGYQRELLMGFMENEATSAIDSGYDGLLIDEFPSDMYYLNSGQKLIIQGEGYFNTAESYPLGVKTEADGNVSFTVNGKEHFDAGQQFFIHDAADDSYHEITTGAWVTNLATGTYTDRFSLRFTNNTLGTVTPGAANGLAVYYTQNNATVTIENNAHTFDIKGVSLYNILGQQVTAWDIKDMGAELFQLPVTNVASGTYIVKLLTSMGPVSKKIIVK